MSKFIEALKQPFDISTPKAIEMIRANPMLKREDKEEDVEFLQRVRMGLTASLGTVDVMHLERVKKSDKRKAAAIQLQLREDKRKKVISIMKMFDIIGDY